MQNVWLTVKLTVQFRYDVVQHREIAVAIEVLLCTDGWSIRSLGASSNSSWLRRLHIDTPSHSLSQ